MRSARDPQSYHLSPKVRCRLGPRPPEDSAGCWQAISRAAARAADAYGARGAHLIEFWDDAFMEDYYKNFGFKPIGMSERKDADNYFQSKVWNDNLLVLIDDFGGIIHSHALVESSLDPEQLIKIGEEHIRRKGLELIRSTSIVFNSYGMDIGKLVYLLTKPEIVVELEWHFNPEVTIKAASIPYFPSRNVQQAE